MDKGYELVPGKRGSNWLLVNLRAKGMESARAEHVLELSDIELNEITVSGDKQAFKPGGVRMSMHTITTCCCGLNGFLQNAVFLDRGVGIAAAIKDKNGTKGKIVDFRVSFEDGACARDIPELNEEVGAFSSAFHIIGYSKEVIMSSIECPTP